MSSSATLDYRAVTVLAERYDARWALPITVCQADGRIIWPESAAVTQPVAQHEWLRLATSEALRWGEPTFTLTPADELLWAVPLMLNGLLLGGLVSWCAAGETGRTTVQEAARDLLRLAVEANLTNAALLAANHAAQEAERRQAEAQAEARGAGIYNLRRLYLLEEPLLAAAIRRHDRGAARAVLNRLLVGIHAAAGERLDLIKSFYAELVVTVCRTAVWSGGAPEHLLHANLVGLAGLSEIDNDERLAHWLRGMLEQAMDVVRAARRLDEAATLAEAIDWLHQHFAENIRRDDVARIGCLSPAHFSRQVRRHFGVTFTELLTQIRIDHAAELLLNSAAPVASVARACGFRDAGYFAKVFARARGCSPREYRRRGAEPVATPA